MHDYKIILTNVRYGVKTVPPITLIHLASQITIIPVTIIDSSGLSLLKHRKMILDTIKHDSEKFIVGISFMSREANEAIELTRYLKELGVKYVIHGGVHPTLFPQESINSGADYIFIGEADNALPELLKKILSGDILGLKIIDEYMSNIKDLKPVNWSYIDCNEYSSYFLNEVQIPIFSARGCFGKCTFCFSSQGKKGVSRFSREYVIRSIKSAYDIGYRHYMFYDDDLLFDLPYVLNLTEELKLLFSELKWDCMASVRSFLKAKELLPSLLDNGMEGCHIGIESIDDVVLQSMQKAHNGKQGRAALKLLLKSKLPIKEALIIALFENDTPFSHQLMVNEFVNNGISPSEALKWIQFATPLPGTPFHKSSKETGISYNGFDTNYVNYIPNSFLNFNLNRIKIKSSNLNISSKFINAIKTGQSMINSMSINECRVISYNLINYIYNQEIIVEK